MKKLIAIGALALAAVAFGDMSLTEARSQIADVVTSPAKMQEVISQLSAEDQVAFLAQVNKAIDKLNASAEEKAALYNDINAAAMRSAKKGNLAALLAEMFATVPPEALTVINETFAANLFSRSVDPSVQISDEEFTNRAKATLEVIQDRCAETDESAVRTTFAILMFLRASEGSPADLKETLVNMIPDPAVRNIALNEWIPAAMAEGFDKTYQPMLGAADAGAEPHLDNVIQLMQNQYQLLLVSDLATGRSDFTGSALPNMSNIGLPGTMSTPTGIDRIPENTNPATPWYGGARRGSQPARPEKVPDEPDPYPYQTTRW